MGELTQSHTLLTVLGRNPRSARYTHRGAEFSAQLAPVALYHLLPDAERPDRVVALCTEEAKEESWPILVEELDEHCEVECVQISAAHDDEAVDAFLRTVAEKLDTDASHAVSFDLTHGFRHLSFLTYSAILYVTALRPGEVRGAYYGLFAEDGSSPFFDLKPLISLPQWVHALRVFEQTGSVLPVASLLEPDSQIANQIAEHLRDVSEAYLSGLPLELGERSYALGAPDRAKPFLKLLRNDQRLPLANEVAQRFLDHVKRFEIADTGGKSWSKKSVLLTRDELARQAALIDELFESGESAIALGLMNEWTVSWTIFCTQNPPDDWLNFQNVRRSAAGVLGAFATAINEPELQTKLTKEQAELGRFWRELGNLRNGYHHHGMRPEVLVGPSVENGKLENVRAYWTRTLREIPDFPISTGRGGTLLVSPVGMRPGVLFSAIHACRAQGVELTDCIAICSKQTVRGVEHALREARFQGILHTMYLEDPFGGREEIERIARHSKDKLFNAECVFVNVTGGTTVMGLTAEKLATEAGRLARPIRRFGLIDRRTPAEQDAEPWRVGEPFWIDADQGDD